MNEKSNGHSARACVFVALYASLSTAASSCRPSSDLSSHQSAAIPANPRPQTQMHWRSAKDIDWTMLETRISAKLEKLFESPPNPQPRFDLVFWIDTNGGLNFDVYQKLPGDKQVRFGDIVKDWNSEMADLDDLFVNLLEEIPEDEAVDAEQEMNARLKDIVRRKCGHLANNNFGYTHGAPIGWNIK